MKGPGKYDRECQAARATTFGSVLLIVVDGVKGSGFSATMEPRVLARVPAILRDVADRIEAEQRADAGRPS